MSTISNSPACERSKGDAIWAVWNPQMWEGELLAMHRQFLHIKFTNKGGLTPTITFIYNEKGKVKRRILWDELVALSHITTGKWLIMGDLNKVLYPSEQKG